MTGPLRPGRRLHSNEGLHAVEGRHGLSADEEPAHQGLQLYQRPEGPEGFSRLHGNAEELFSMTEEKERIWREAAAMAVLRQLREHTR